ncbi:hypothetical protein [Longirhabdus pacifica]|nr:hypothetical protein [Longirhabdus pacifica]
MPEDHKETDEVKEELPELQVENIEESVDSVLDNADGDHAKELNVVAC